MPAGCYVGVRVGDVLKQGRYEPSRSYHFPGLDRRRNAKIDIYRHVGSCVVALDPDATSTHEVKVSHSDPTMPEMKLKVNVASSIVDTGKKREERTKAVKHQAQDYLTKFNIENELSDAVKALLKEQPADPMAFLCKHLATTGRNFPASPVSIGTPMQAAPKAPLQSKIGAQPGKPTGEALSKPFKGYYAANCLPSVPPACSASLFSKFPAAAHRLTPKVPAAASAPKGTLSKEQEISDLRNKARDALVQLDSTASKEIVDLRNKARDALVKKDASSSEIVVLRNKARQVLVEASGDGCLLAALQDVRMEELQSSAPRKDFNFTPSVGTWLTSRRPYEGPKKIAPQSNFHKLASVGTWLVPRLRK